MKITDSSLKYIYMSIITFIIGYIFLRYAYDKVSNIPFLQEIVLIVLGTVVTIIITASLLNKQTEVEIEKEQRVKIFDIRSNTYTHLIEMIEGFISKGKVSTSDILKMEFLTHKISLVASYKVLSAYSKFLKTFKKVSKNNKINIEEGEELSLQLAKLCSTIRGDLLKTEGEEKNIESIITKNIHKV